MKGLYGYLSTYIYLMQEDIMQVGKLSTKSKITIGIVVPIATMCFLSIPSSMSQTISTGNAQVEDFVQSLGNELLAIVYSKNTTTNEIDMFKNTFVPCLHKNIPQFIAQSIWSIISDNDRQRFVDAIQNYFSSMSFYVLKVGFIDELIVTGSSTLGTDSNVMVESKLTRSLAHKLPKNMQWRLFLVDKEYKIVDINIDGNSILIGRKIEIESILNDNGKDIDDLIDILNKKSIDLQASCQKE